MSRRDEILAKICQIPSLPPVAAEAITLLREGDASAGQIAQLIERDPALTANLLRMANSAYLGLPIRVDSVRAAVVRLGMEHVGQLITSFAVMPVAQRPLAGYELAPAALWEHALAVALATAQLTRLAHTQPPADTYTAGLLHDLGKLVLDPFVAQESKAIRQLAFDGQTPFDIAERQVLGIDHAEAGAALLESWHLPENLVTAVRYHHEPESAPNRLVTLVDLLHVGDQIVTLSGIGLDVGGTNYQTSSGAMSRLGIRPSLVEKSLGKTMAAFREIRSLYAPSTTKGTAA